MAWFDLPSSFASRSLRLISGSRAGLRLQNFWILSETFAGRPSYLFRNACKTMTNVRAVRYRRLALQESDKAKARLLNLLAEEAERGVLVTSDGLRRLPPENTASRYDAIQQGADAKWYIGS
jgi:hypothetical protein